MSMAHDTKLVSVTLVGPDGVWFGVAFAAKQMADVPYAFIVDGFGQLTERKLGDHGPGTELVTSVTLLTTTVTDGMRTVTFSRPVAGLSPDHYTIPSSPGQIDVLVAVGSGPQLAYHNARSGATFALLPTTQSACLCTPETHKFLSYMGATSEEYSVFCAPEPRVTLTHSTISFTYTHFFLSQLIGRYGGRRHGSSAKPCL
jgi:hypothetical protein